MSAQPDEIQIRVVTFASAAAALGFDERIERLPAGSRASDVLTQVEQQFPRLATLRGRLRLAVNARYADESAVLRDGDELALIPPVSGG